MLGLSPAPHVLGRSTVLDDDRLARLYFTCRNVASRCHAPCPRHQHDRRRPGWTPRRETAAEGKQAVISSPPVQTWYKNRGP